MLDECIIGVQNVWGPRGGGGTQRVGLVIRVWGEALVRRGTPQNWWAMLVGQGTTKNRTAAPAKAQAAAVQVGVEMEAMRAKESKKLQRKTSKIKLMISRRAVKSILWVENQVTNEYKSTPNSIIDAIES